MHAASVVVRCPLTPVRLGSIEIIACAPTAWDGITRNVAGQLVRSRHHYRSNHIRGCKDSSEAIR
jgi:hypothetical protein